MRAFLFPGQGSQAVGMGAALAEASRAARDTFDEVDEALGQGLFRLMRDGPDEDLRLTENAQPAIMTHALAVFHSLTKEGGVDLAKGLIDFGKDVVRGTAGLGKRGAHAYRLAALSRKKECAHYVS